MMNNNLEEYKNAILAKYEVSKDGVNASFLVLPSRAKLRNLCFQLFKETCNLDDLKTFTAFCGFDFSPMLVNKMKDVTDKFRPIETFFKGETVLSDIEALNMAAILVDFESRPFLKFCKGAVREHFINRENQYDLPQEEKILGKDTILSVLNSNLKEVSSPQRFYIKQVVISVFLTFLACGIGFYLFSQEECMQWQGDHYEIVDCKDNKTMGFAAVNAKVTLNKNMLNFKKIQVSDSTTFFKDHKAVVWYCKNGDQLEFYNSPGFKPENDKPLKPITSYMIKKYIVKNMVSVSK